MFSSLPEARRKLDARDFRAIHNEALHVVSEFKDKEAELIRVLQKVDANKVYRFAGYNSLFRYVVESLRLSESQAYSYIAVARKSLECPQLQKPSRARRSPFQKRPD